MDGRADQGVDEQEGGGQDVGEQGEGTLTGSGRDG